MADQSRHYGATTKDNNQTDLQKIRKRIEELDERLGRHDLYTNAEIEDIKKEINTLKRTMRSDISLLLERSDLDDLTERQEYLCGEHSHLFAKTSIKLRKPWWQKLCCCL